LTKDIWHLERNCNCAQKGCFVVPYCQRIIVNSCSVVSKKLLLEEDEQKITLVKSQWQSKDF